MYVCPESRGRGVATALVCHALRFAATLRLEEIYLWFPAKDEATLRRLYARLGWCEREKTIYCGESILIGAFTIAPKVSWSDTEARESKSDS